MKNLEIINTKKVIFWDFDGVIKDSVDIKTKAYIDIFSNLSNSQKNKIISHHTKNGGVSRYEKIPLYLQIANIKNTKHEVNNYINKFSSHVCESVIKSPWVPGVKSFLKNTCNDKKNILTTATPLKEIEYILSRLSIKNFFDSVFGSPKSKKQAIKESIDKLRLSEKDCIMIGDSSSDYEAAYDCGINFMLRETKYNQDLIKKADYLFRDFL